MKISIGNLKIGRHHQKERVFFKSSITSSHNITKTKTKQLKNIFYLPTVYKYIHICHIDCKENIVKFLQNKETPVSKQLINIICQSIENLVFKGKTGVLQSLLPLLKAFAQCVNCKAASGCAEPGNNVHSRSSIVAIPSKSS